MRSWTFGIFLALSIGSSTCTAAILRISDGILTGAFDVDVSGTLYDVEFNDGTCADLFTGCDSLTDFTFTTGTLAIAASQALLDQVFVDGLQGNFDSSPRFIRGCSDNTGQGFCSVFTPVDFLVNNYLAQNSSIEAGDLVRAAFTLSGENLSIYDTTVYAVWSPHGTTTGPIPSSAVPIPSSAALLVTGIIALGVMGRRRACATHRR